MNFKSMFPIQSRIVELVLSLMRTASFIFWWRHYSFSVVSLGEANGLTLHREADGIGLFITQEWLSRIDGEYFQDLVLCKLTPSTRLFHNNIICMMATTGEPPDLEQVLHDLKNQFESDDISNALNGNGSVSLDIGKAYLAVSSTSDQLLKAFQWIERSAETGNLEAEFRLAELYSLGHGTSQDNKMAFEWYTKSALQGYHKALNKLHRLYSQDIATDRIIDTTLFSDTSKEKERLKLSGIKQYFSTQFDIYQTSDLEDETIQEKLGFLCQHGYSVKKSSAKAMECYEKAAEKGLVGAQLNLGILYQKNQQNEFSLYAKVSNYKKAVYWYKKAAENGNITAQNHLACMYWHGFGIKKDRQKAISLYKQSALKGNMDSQITLGRLYRIGQCVPKILPEAVKWYDMAAKQNSKVARNCLAKLYDSVPNDNENDLKIVEIKSSQLSRHHLCLKLHEDVDSVLVEKDDNELKELSRCALMSDGFSMYKVGVHYCNGTVFPKDTDIGCKWIAKAAKAGYHEAQYYLATTYEDMAKNQDIDVLTTTQYYTNAYTWYKKAAGQDHAKAQYKLGLFYENGYGVEKNLREAEIWYSKSAKGENADGQYHLGMLICSKFIPKNNNEERIKWNYTGEIDKMKETMENAVCLLKNSSDQGHPEASYMMGLLYENSFRTEEENSTISLNKDLKSAKRYYEKAIRIYKTRADGAASSQLTLTTIYTNNLLGKTVLQSNTVQDDNANVAEADNSHSSVKEDNTDSKLLCVHYQESLNNHTAFFYEIPQSKNVFYTDYYPEILIFSENQLEVHLAEAEILECKDGTPGSNQYLEKSIDFIKKPSRENSFRADYTISRCQKKQEYQVNKKNPKPVLVPLPESGFKIVIEQNLEYVKTDHPVVNDKLDKDSLSGQLALGRIFSGRFQLKHFALKNDIVQKNNSIAVNYLKLASIQGDPNAQYQLACIRLKESKEKEDYCDAYKLFQTSAERGNSDAKSLFDLQLKFPVAVNSDQFVKMLMNCSQYDFGTVHHQLGHLYEYGSSIIGSNLIQQSYPDAIKYYQKAANSGITQSMYQLGLLYEKGKGVPVDLVYAKKLYEKASQSDHADSSYRLARLHYNEMVYGTSLSKAFDYYTCAANGGNIFAEEILNLEVENNSHDLSNFERKLEMYKEAKKHHKYNTYILGLVYKGKRPDFDNIKKAADYYTEAIKYNITRAHYELGQLYEEESKREKYKREQEDYEDHNDRVKYESPLKDFIGQYKSYTEACLKKCVEHYTNASENGDIDAMYRLGLLYLHEKGVKKDNEKAFEMLSKAAELGNLEAKRTMDLSQNICVNQNELLDSVSVDIHRQETVNMYAELANSGNTNAQYKLGIYYEEVLSMPEYSIAKTWYSMAAEENHMDALYRLGRLYEEGKGVEKNIDKSISFYLKAAEFGCENSLSKLANFLKKANNISTKLEIQVDHYKKLALKGNAAAQCITGYLYFVFNPDSNGTFESLKWLSKSYQLGNKDVESFLERIFDHGIDTTKHNKKRKKFLLKCVKMNIEFAYYEIATFYYNETCKSKNYPQAFKNYWISARKYNNIDAKKYIQLNSKNPELQIVEKEKLKKMFTKAANTGRGDVKDKYWIREAQYQLGVYYQQKHEQKSYQHQEQTSYSGESAYIFEALKYFKKAVEYGHTTAEYELAVIYLGRGYIDKAETHLINLEGQGSSNVYYQLGKLYIHYKPDIERGINYLQRSTKMGNVMASDSLGLIYKEGKYLPQNYTKALDYFEKGAKKGYSESQFNLAVLYQTLRNYLQAADWYEKSVKNGNKEAKFQLGMMYLKGEGVPRHKEMALKYLKEFVENEHPEVIYYLAQFNEQKGEHIIELLKRSASEGSNKAQHDLGMIYLNGEITTQDYYQAFSYLFEAANKGNNNSQYPLGWLYENGKGTTKNYDEAIACYEKSNKYENKELQYRIGLLYNYGAEPDHEKAFSHFKAAADKGHLGAKYQLGLVYEHGIHIEKNYKAAFELYRDSACQQNPDSHYRVGLMYTYGKYVEKNISKAIEHLLQYERHNEFHSSRVLKSHEASLFSKTDNVDIAELYNKNIVDGKNESHYSLSLICFNIGAELYDTSISNNFLYYAANKGDSYHQLENGLIQLYKNNPEEALQWIAKSANNGNTRAKNILGILYMNDKAVYYSKLKALQYFNGAAKQGDSNSQFNLASIYHYGQYEEQNIEKAIYWYKKSAKQGCNASQFALGLIYKDQEIYSDAFYYFNKAAENNHIDAQYFLGLMYENGMGTEKNSEEAERWYMKSKSQEEDSSSFILAKLYHSRDDTAQALKWYNKALGTRHVSSAERGIGLIYEYTHKNYSKAFEYYLGSANKRNKTGCYEIGRMYYSGKGVKKSTRKALVWFNKLVSGPCDDTTQHIYIEVKRTSLVSDEEEELEYWFESEKDIAAKAQSYIDEASVSGLDISWFKKIRVKNTFHH
ncbi:HCP-like protein [Backusella circina FSU 941]|nr:HCP-like protein [Backusella circina FSU 941]